METLLEFRAGKMYMEGKTVVPDTRKGLLRILRGDEDLVHFQWIDRDKNVVEDDQIVFPEEAVFEKEPNSENDWQLCCSVNHHIHHQAFSHGDTELPEGMHEDDVSSRNAIDGRAGNVVAASTHEAAGEVSSSGPVKLEDLQRILNNINSVDGIYNQDGGLGLGDILKPDLLGSILQSLPVDERLVSCLPEGQWSAEDIIELLQSPAVRQQIDSFTYVLKTGQIDLSQFGIDASKYKFTVLSFLEALEDSVPKQLDDSFSSP